MAAAGGETPTAGVSPPGEFSTKLYRLSLKFTAISITAVFKSNIQPMPL